MVRLGIWDAIAFTMTSLWCGNKYLPVSSKLSCWGAVVVHPESKDSLRKGKHVRHIARSLYYCCLIMLTHMMTSSNANIFRVTGHLCGEFTGDRWIPLTKASDAELCFLWSASWINGWVNNCESGDLRRHHAHYDVIVMYADTDTESIATGVWF